MKDLLDGNSYLCLFLVELLTFPLNTSYGLKLVFRCSYTTLYLMDVFINLLLSASLWTCLPPLTPSTHSRWLPLPFTYFLIDYFTQNVSAGVTVLLIAYS